MPRQRSRSPLSPILATESATVRLFFILSVLLCSVNKAGLKTETWLLYCLRLRSRSPHNAKHSTSYIIIYNYWGERGRAPSASCGLNGRAVTIDIYIDIYIRPALRYCACAALRANVAGRSSWVSIFSLHRIGIESDLSPAHLGLQTRGGGARFPGICKVARGAY